MTACEHRAPLNYLSLGKQCHPGEHCYCKYAEDEHNLCCNCGHRVRHVWHVCERECMEERA